MSLTAIVTLVLAAAAVSLAYRDEKLGAALVTGAAVLTALYLLLGVQDAASDAPETPVPLVSAAVPAQTPVAPEASPGPTATQSRYEVILNCVISEMTFERADRVVSPKLRKQASRKEQWGNRSSDVREERPGSTAQAPGPCR